ncbi:MAG TPA: sigma-70 family RNA polymerase sigma factor [Thermoanaerobaculia bacterium]|nr:sigma-70 family RNA polymerase sigma factor [Thermoanaerobaculia bacterium]
MSADARDFESLLQRYARLMASAVRKVCGREHRDLVPDVEQEIYLALWKRLQDGKEIRHPVSYLYKVALTTALAFVRRRGGEATTNDGGELERPPTPLPGADGLLPAERRLLLEQVLRELPREQARAVRAYLAGFNHQEVAALYGWSEPVARHRIYRGLESLRGKLVETSR